MAAFEGMTPLMVAAVLVAAVVFTTSTDVNNVTRNDTFACDVTNASSCDVDECCVKKVSWRLEDANAQLEVSTECQALLTTGQLCLLKPLGYLCDCSPGLVCKPKRKDEDFGHCAKA